MPKWEADSGGGLRLSWSSPDDFMAYLNGTVAPAALQYGFRIVVEPVLKTEAMTDRT